MQDWKTIWNRRGRPSDEIDLGVLLKLDGFDTGAGRIGVDGWQAYVKTISTMLEMKNGNTVYEVGCGAGAFLHALKQLLVITVGGLDYSIQLIETAKDAMPAGDFQVLEANALAVTPQYDFILANSVFQYFDVEYASKVLSKMMHKARRAVAIMDIPDRATKVESERMRRDALTAAEYDKRYRGLEHTYYERDWFFQEAKGHGCVCDTYDACVPDYAQNRFRFGVIIRK